MNISAFSPAIPGSALRAGAQGVQTGMDQLARTGSDIARLNNPLPDTEGRTASLESSLVTQVEAKHLVQSSARSIEVASETIGTLLDVKA